MSLGELKGLQGPRGTWQCWTWICLANLRASFHKCSCYSLGPRFPLWKQEYWTISAIRSHSDILLFCGVGHVHFLSNAMSLAPEFKIILPSCETERDFKGKVTWLLSPSEGGVREKEGDWLGARPRQDEILTLPFFSTETLNKSLNLFEPRLPLLNFQIGAMTPILQMDGCGDQVKLF